MGCNMQKKVFSLIITPLLLISSVSQAAEITACVVDENSKDNPTYFHLPTVSTKLICDLNMGAKYRPTLKILYKNGWRLIHTVDPALVNQKNQKRASHVFYLEREQKPKK